ncbi:UNVERIFIED_ORG: hypothetical protein M2328_006433 [Rhodococcus erythropolis]
MDKRKECNRIMLNPVNHHRMNFDTVARNLNPRLIRATATPSVAGLRRSRTITPPAHRVGGANARPVASRCVGACPAADHLPVSSEMNSAALRSVKSIDLFSLLAFRFSSAVTCAQPLAAQAPADGSEKFSSLARSRQNFLGPGVALRPPHADAILLCQKAKKIGGARGPVTFTARGTTCRTSV